MDKVKLYFFSFDDCFNNYSPKLCITWKARFVLCIFFTKLFFYNLPLISIFLVVSYQTWPTKLSTSKFKRFAFCFEKRGCKCLFYFRNKLWLFTAILLPEITVKPNWTGLFLFRGFVFFQYLKIKLVNKKKFSGKCSLRKQNVLWPWINYYILQLNSCWTKSAWIFFYYKFLNDFFKNFEIILSAFIALLKLTGLQFRYLEYYSQKVYPEIWSLSNSQRDNKLILKFL